MPSHLQGIQSLLKDRPSLCVEMVIRVILATAIVIQFDAFLKLVVTPALAATGIGLLLVPFTFFVGQAAQPIIHSWCFIAFDDRFVLASLEASGAKDRLVKGMGLEKWGEMAGWEKLIMRHGVMKSSASFFVGMAGIFAYIPLLGPVLVALFSGWAVAWDMVYVPLSCMGYVGVPKQGRSVYANFRKYYWFGFWSVLIEQLPLVGAACHVYNIYRAAEFLENVYLSDQKKQS